MAVDILLQETLSLTRSTGKTVSITCKGTTGCESYIHWYQKKEKEAFKRILYMALSGGAPIKDDGFQDFTATKKESDTFSLTIYNLQASYHATYYCACWVSHTGRLVKAFGSGTKLIVSGKLCFISLVTAYPPSKLQDGKSAWLCVASGMVPDAVRFKWTEKGKNEREKGGNIREQKTGGDGGYTTSMLIIDQDRTAQDKKYTCSVDHEAVQDESIQADTAEGGEREKDAVVPTCAPRPNNETTLRPDLFAQKKQTALREQEYFDLQRSLYLANRTYTLMILKSVTYIGVACVLMYKRSSADGPITRR
ncbi:hypothetical protein AAFF_G00122380 [Aldrovandia affinis]|uniref:Ig-like domain-containing protein n=1 Tax=Aldrovandia affinis TaxID=143900 RepID=A0AAD7WA76_9TELE|nr:hypothetical protein AAFF_G00122380 [Aldrovandia affinis]